MPARSAARNCGHDFNSAGELAGDIGEFEQGLHQLKLSDKLNGDRGFHRFAVKNKVNIIRLLMQSVVVVRPTL